MLPNVNRQNFDRRATACPGPCCPSSTSISLGMCWLCTLVASQSLWFWRVRPVLLVVYHIQCACTVSLVFRNCANTLTNEAPAYKGLNASQGLAHSCMCTQPAQEPCCCARLYSATATDCMAFRAPAQSMGPCSSCTATAWRRRGSRICIATTLPCAHHGFESSFYYWSPLCCRSPCWRVARAQSGSLASDSSAAIASGQWTLRWRSAGPEPQHTLL